MLLFLLVAIIYLTILFNPFKTTRLLQIVIGLMILGFTLITILGG